MVKQGLDAPRRAGEHVGPAAKKRTLAIIRADDQRYPVGTAVAKSVERMLRQEGAAK
ncbi:hypothetical protein [Cryobacterium sp. TMT1-66-1]|uniref:hypothetical protein n=1 Tax=Cryobacterium sp. TMT1-66-1 TaxID=1259242 RepID=UPI001F545FBE|nr:hypothetical protein [Cryobacterium sp. TMT1-66-1]